MSAGFDFYSSGPGGAIVELRVAEKRRGRQYLYFDGELRVLNQKLANNLASLDDPDVEEKAGPWKQMTTVLGIRGVFGQLPDRDESRHLLADRLKPPTLPPREQCVDLYNSVTYRALGGDEIDYSVFPVKPANPTLRQTMRIYGDPVSIRKTIDVALQSHAQETGIPLNDGGHYVFHSDFRPHDAASVMYSSDMIPFEHLALSLKDMETTGECYLGTSLSLQLQFYARPSSSILRRMIIGGAHVSFDKAGLADSEVLLWDDRTEQLVAAGRQTLHMTRFPIAALDSLRMTQTKKGSGTGKGEVRIGNANGGVASRL